MSIQATTPSAAAPSNGAAGAQASAAADQSIVKKDAAAPKVKIQNTYKVEEYKPSFSDKARGFINGVGYYPLGGQIVGVARLIVHAVAAAIFAVAACFVGFVLCKVNEQQAYLESFKSQGQGVKRALAEIFFCGSFYKNSDQKMAAAKERAFYLNQHMPKFQFKGNFEDGRPKTKDGKPETVMDELMLTYKPSFSNKEGYKAVKDQFSKKTENQKEVRPKEIALEKQIPASDLKKMSGSEVDKLFIRGKKNGIYQQIVYTGKFSLPAEVLARKEASKEAISDAAIASFYKAAATEIREAQEYASRFPKTWLEQVRSDVTGTQVRKAKKEADLREWRRMDPTHHEGKQYAGTLAKIGRSLYPKGEPSIVDTEFPRKQVFMYRHSDFIIPARAPFPDNDLHTRPILTRPVSEDQRAMRKAEALKTALVVYVSPREAIFKESSSQPSAKKTEEKAPKAASSDMPNEASKTASSEKGKSESLLFSDAPRTKSPVEQLIDKTNAESDAELAQIRSKTDTQPSVSAPKNSGSERERKYPLSSSTPSSKL